MMATNTSSQPVCQNCTTSTTPLWRRDEFGSVLCNACGLFLKLHGRPRPISLKTDVIKSRNRVKTIRPDLASRKKVGPADPLARGSSCGLRPNASCLQQQQQQQPQQQVSTVPVLSDSNDANAPAHLECRHGCAGNTADGAESRQREPRGMRLSHPAHGDSVHVQPGTPTFYG